MFSECFIEEMEDIKGAGKYMTGYKTVAGMVKAMIEELNITVPVALHLDHGTYEGCYKCIKAGFTSIMFDGSHYPIAENIEKTKELVKAAHDRGLSIEAEVGSIGGEEDGVIGKGECADPNECKQSLILALICLQLVSVTSTVSTQRTGKVFHLRLLMQFSSLQVRCHSFFTVVQVSLQR